MQSNAVRQILMALVAACLAVGSPRASAAEHAQQQQIPAVNAERAYGYLVEVCRLGTRVSGSRGMAAQQQLIADHFAALDVQVGLQSFDAVHPLSGAPVRMTNMIVNWHPEAQERVLIACHYDTRPLPDEDRYNPRGRFLGANDGASGVALLMELGHHIRHIEPTFGIDFVFREIFLVRLPG